MFIAATPVNQPLQDLTKGMYRNFHSTRMPAGSLWTAKNYIVNQRGPYRRPGDEAVYTSAGYGFPIKGMVNFWKTDGSQVSLVFDKHVLYTISGSALVILSSTVGDTYSTGTITSVGTTVTGDGTNWGGATDITAGDVILIGTTLAVIIAVDSTTQLILDRSVTATAGTAYIIHRAWQTGEPYSVDSVITTDENDTPGVLFTDYNRAPRFYDGTTFDDFDSGLTYIAGCCEVFNERVYIGNTIESALKYRQRIRWSTTDDHTDFGTSAWMDLPYSAGALLRLVKFSSMLVAYFEDAIWIGRLTSMDNPPVLFERVETGGVGLVGMRAVQPWIGGHFCILRDNIYILSQNGLKPIGTQVVKETINSTDNLHSCTVAVDPVNERAIFAFPGTGSTLVKLWSYHYRADSWSYDEIENVSTIAYLGFTSQVTWDNIASTPYKTGSVHGSSGQSVLTGLGVSWTATNGVAAGDRVFLTNENKVIATVLNATSLNLTSNLTYTHSTAAYYVVQAAEDWDTKMADYPSWDAINAETLGNRLYIGTETGAINRLSEDGTSDINGLIEAVLETGDFDYGKPNQVKTATALSVKIDTFLTAPLSFTLEGSKNRGNTWKSLGTISIPVGYDEGRVTFKLTSTTHRFRLTSNSLVGPYTIMELVMRIAPRGEETRFATT